MSYTSRNRTWQISLVALMGCLVIGCNFENSLDELAKFAAEHKDELKKVVERKTTTLASTVSLQAAEKPADQIRIASFNIQVFGTSKSRKRGVMSVLADVMTHFDVIAIQEIRSQDSSIIPNFIAQVNAKGHVYDYVIGPRLGRSSSKEQYVYIFDQKRIEIDPNSVHTVNDRSDLLHREPLIARFRVRGPPPSDAFTFTLINIHTDPDEVDTEIDALAQVFTVVQRNQQYEDDVILLGDLNAAPKHFGQLQNIKNITWAIDNQPTNTRLSKCYDNILFDRYATQEFTGESDVLNLMDAYNLTEKQALLVSDHMPVWASFRMIEAGRGPVATRPGVRRY